MVILCAKRFHFLTHTYHPTPKTMYDVHSRTTTTPDGRRITDMDRASFPDRLRALLSGRIRVVSKTATGNLVGHYETNAVAHVEPSKLLRR